MKKTLLQYKYKILCFVLFVSLVGNISLYHENRIYKKGILQAMKMLGIGGLEDDSLPVKSQVGLLNEYLEELWFKEFLLRDQNED